MNNKEDYGGKEVRDFIEREKLDKKKTEKKRGERQERSASRKKSYSVIIQSQLPPFSNFYTFHHS